MKTAVILFISLFVAPSAYAQMAKIASSAPVTFEINAISAEIHVFVTDANKQVELRLSDSSTKTVVLSSKGDRVTPSFDGGPKLHSGKAEIFLPMGSSALVRTISGDVFVQGGTDMQIRTTSGDVTVFASESAEMETISGDIDARATRLKISTVSGDARTRTPPKVDGQVTFTTTSGDLSWLGHCAKKCRIEANSVSGDIELLPDAQSSFELAFASFSGDWKLDKSLAVGSEAKRSKAASFGDGAGKMSIETYSGDLSVSVPKE
jgi:hypothetical protein